MLSSRPAALEDDAPLFHEKTAHFLRIAAAEIHFPRHVFQGFGQSSGLMLQPGKHVFQILFSSVKAGEAP